MRWCIVAVEYYSALKKNEVTPLAPTWMVLELIILSKPDKYCMISFICGIQKKKNYKNELTYTAAETDLQISKTNLWLPNGKGAWGIIYTLPGFPGGSAGKESACNMGDLGSTPWLSRSPG